MNRTILTVTGVLSASSLLLVDSAVKGTVLLAFAAVVALILRRDSAATRHLVWLLAIVAMLVVPVLSALLPQWRVLPAWMSSTRPAVADVSPPSVGKPTGGVIESPVSAAPVEVEQPSATVFQPTTAPPVSQPAVVTPAEVPAPMVWSWNWINALPLVWAIGFAVLMLRLSAARWMLWNSERLATVVCRRGVGFQLADDRERTHGRLEAYPTARDPIVVAMKAICLQLGIGRPVTLLIHPDKTIPVVWGIFRCRLMLPAAAQQWSDEQLQSVLLHELAHIKRRDTIVQLLAQVACALHWFNPLVWFAAWRLDVERERSCDDLVLASGIRPSAYAGHLLDVVTGLSPARWTQACGLAMARKSSLEGRLTAVLGKDLNRRGVSVALAGLALAVAVGIAVPIAMLRAADEWNPPHGAHIGSYEFSAFCIHDGKESTFVIAYQGDFDSTSRSSSNSKARTWTDSVTLTAKKPGIALSFHRTHTAPGKLSITTAPAEGRDLSKPAPPPREFGQKEYDLAKGRVFLLSDNGNVRQLDIATPVVTDQESAKKLAALIAAVPPQDREDVVPTPNLTGKLAPETVAKLKWGEPVNGLRMALAWPPSFDEELLGSEAFFQLVVQNVSNKEIHFHAGDNAPNPRELTSLANDRAVLVFDDEETAKADWHLQAGHCGVLRMFMKEMHGYYGTVSTGIERDLSKIDGNLAVAEMEVAKAPAGAWTGKLVSGPTRGSADVAAAPAPMHKDARSLYEIWLRHARANGDIPGALVGELAASVKTFIRYNPTWVTVPKLNELLPRLDATHDWKPADAIALLDEVAGIQDSPLKPVPWKGTRHTIRQGESLPKKFADAPWGEAQPNGLRAAWVLEPGAAEHRIGAALKARLLVQNSGKVPVMLQVPTWHQGWVKAADAKGAEVQVSGISWTTMAMLTPVRLRPGDYIEIDTPGVGIGPRAGMGPWAGPRVGSNVLAKAGDELTLTHGLVPLDGSEVGVSEDDPHDSGPGWWLAHIQARLNRELPLPADAAERTRLLDRAVRELFATAPTAEETAAFIADRTPDALDALAKRLTARVDVVSFSGKLPTAPAKFRVLAADANADKQPRVVLGPGEYPLPSTTARRGDATLKIVGRPVGDRRTNDAQLLFEATEFTGALPPDPHKLEVPDGWGTWAIVCRPDSGVLYLLSKGAVRKIDYTKPRNVSDTLANDLPAEFRDEVKRQFDIHEISAAQQAVVFEKPAPPAATPEAEKQKGAAVKLTLDALLGFWRGTMDGKDLMLSFHRPPVEKDVQLDLYFGRATIGRLARFNIAPDGDSALVVLEGGDNAALGTLRPIDANTMRLEGADKEGKAAAFAMLTRDVEPPATEPRQKEARELFEMWKRTANEDGTIPGTFIGQLATEVRAYVMANPNSDSGMKLPKLLPRFVTSRDWTQAEAIKLLDDLAYYSTRPIVARVAKAKLPSGPLWRTEVEFADIPVKISKWSEAKDGLRVGMRVVDADWRIGLGGGARVELWLHNAGDKDVTFKTTGPDRQDTGVAVAAIDAEGREHWADGVNVLIYAGPMDCKLPAGHVALAKKFEVTFAEPGSHEKTWLTPRFHGLKHGKYQLRCKWMDAYPDISKPGEWKGELTAPDHAFTLAAAVSAADLEAKPAPKLAKLPLAAAAPQAAETPKTTEQEAFTAWGKEIGGLQAGLGFKAGEKRVYTHGETATLVVRVRNVGQNDIKFKYYPTFLSENSPTVLDETGKRVSLRGNTLRLVKHDVPKEVNLAVGKEIELHERELRLASGNEDAGELKTRDIFPTGKFLIQHEQVIGNSAQASNKLDPTLEKLATGKLEFEVREPFTAWGKEVGGLQAGLGFKVGEKRAYTHGEWATLVVRVRNVGKEEVKFQYLRQFFVEQPPTVFHEKGELKQLGRVDAFGEHIPVEVKLAAGKEIELYELKLYLGTGSEEGIPKYPYIFGTGKFQVQYEKVLGNSSSGSIKLDPALSKLATGKLELAIKPVEPMQQEPKPEAQSRNESQKPKEYGPQDWAGWFVNQVQYRKQSDGSYPAVAFKSLRKWVSDDLAGEPNALGAVEARAWLETTAADKKWVAADFQSLVERIGKWRLSVIQRALPVEEIASRSFPKPGRPATADELRDLRFGPATENGLRIAWVFDPAKKDFAIGESLKCRVVLHNSGSQPVQFVAWDVLDGVWAIRDATGKPIQTEDVDNSQFWNIPRMATYQRYRLAPGHILEIHGKGIGIGDTDHSAAKNQMAIWRIIHARAGDAVQICVETKLGLVQRFGEFSSVELTVDEFPEEKTRDWSGSLRSGEVKFSVVAPAVLKKDVPKQGAMLKPAIEQKLKWGEPVNGLHAALVMHPVPDEPDVQDKNDIFLVVQNVSPAKIWLHSSDAAPNPRQLIWRDKRVLETITETAQPIPADYQLHPGEVAFFRMLLPPRTRNPGGRSSGSQIEESIRRDPDFDLTGKMEIETAPAGAWTGKLLSGEIKGGTAIPVVSPEENQSPAPKAGDASKQGATPVPAAEKPKGAQTKLMPDGLLGFWKGTLNKEDIMLSFHRPPVEKDVQLDIYFGEATIGALMTFAIAPDGGSVTLRGAGGDGEWGRLVPGEGGTLQLEAADKESRSGKATLTRDVEKPSTVPRQAEARELFEMWKTTANSDGAIPGTFIEMLATEVRAYVKANPTLDSAIKLPKLLPRFVTSRNWTQVEAIKLLDDVAYNSTAPIKARVAKSKLPSGPMWRTLVEFQDIPVAIAK